MTLTKRQSNMFYIAKAFALIFIVVSHMPFEKGYVTMEAVRGTLGQIGVFVYFFCSGFFYTRKENDTKIFWTNKLKSVIQPWMIFATATFCLTIILSGDYTNAFLKYFKWTIGIGSVYWYMLMLMMCYVLFKHIYNKETILYFCVVISVASIYMSAFKIVEVSQYINLLNWIGVFAFGIIARRKNLIERFYSLPLFLVSFVLLIVFVWLSAKRCVPIKSYIDVYSMPVEILACIVVFGVASVLYKSNLLIDIGNKSFFVYLIHIQIAGIVNTRLPSNALFFILRPIIVIVLCYAVAKCVEFSLKKTHMYERFGKFFALR